MSSDQVVAAEAGNNSVEEKLSFRVNLWDKYVELMGKLTNGKNYVKSLQAMMKTIYELQEKFGKSFSKFKLDDKNLGCLGDSNIKINNLFGTFGIKHVQMANDINGLLYKELTALRKELSQSIKEAGKNEKKLRTEFNSAMSAVKSAKTKDHDEKKNYEKLQITLLKATEMPPKKLQALQKQVHEAEKSSKRAEADYLASVKKLHQVNEKYYEKLGELMQSLEELELKRIEKIKFIFDKYSELQLDFCNVVNDASNSLKATSQEINAEKDIQDFIKQTMSYQKPPPPPEFEPYQVDIPEEVSNQRFSVAPGGIKPVVEKTSPSTTLQTPNPSEAVILASSNSTAAETPNPPPTMTVIKTVKALYDYNPESGEELQLIPGEIIQVLEINDDGWWLGMTGTRTGYFPSNYVEECADIPAAAAATEMPHDNNTVISEPEPEIPTEEVVGQEEVAMQQEQNILETTVALYDFEAQEEGEVSFKTGDVIHVLAKNDDGWWYGTANGQTGLFPSNYTQAGNT